MSSETSFDLDGDLVVVDAVVVGPRGTQDARLILDTGAVLTTLAPTLAEAIGYTPAARITRSVIRSAVGNEYGYIVRLVQLSTLGFTVRDLHVDVANLGPDIDGVLGMNFLADFNFEVRPAERVIRLEPLGS